MLMPSLVSNSTHRLSSDTGLYAQGRSHRPTILALYEEQLTATLRSDCEVKANCKLGTSGGGQFRIATG
jgi:hypothetical protein